MSIGCFRGMYMELSRAHRLRCLLKAASGKNLAADTGSGATYRNCKLYYECTCTGFKLPIQWQLERDSEFAVGARNGRIKYRAALYRAKANDASGDGPPAP